MIVVNINQFKKPPPNKWLCLEQNLNDIKIDGDELLSQKAPSRRELKKQEKKSKFEAQLALLRDEKPAELSKFNLSQQNTSNQIVNENSMDIKVIVAAVQ